MVYYLKTLVFRDIRDFRKLPLDLVIEKRYKYANMKLVEQGLNKSTKLEGKKPNLR
jgi:hypothetical protein